MVMQARKNVLMPILFLLLFIVANSEAQTNNDSVYSNPEQVPSFVGGNSNLRNFINVNMMYPETALQKNIEGTVMVKFVVDKNGAIRGPVVLKSVAPSLDSEALRIVSVMPRWVSGKQGGQNVNAKYTQSIDFNIRAYKSTHPGVVTSPSPGFDLDKFFKDNLSYSESALGGKKEGFVVVTFAVSEDGTLSDFTVRRSLNPTLDAEALRVLNKMPKWKPAVQDGKPVKTKFTQPVKFSTQ